LNGRLLRERFRFADASRLQVVIPQTEQRHKNREDQRDLEDLQSVRNFTVSPFAQPGVDLVQLPVDAVLDLAEIGALAHLDPAWS